MKKQETSEELELPQLGTNEFNNLASACFGGKPKQEPLKHKVEIIPAEEISYQ